MTSTLVSETPHMVTVTVDTVGTVRIGTEPGRAPRSAPLPAQGGVLVVDPYAPDGPPHARINDLSRAGAWLNAVFGDDIAEAATRTLAEARQGRVRPEDPVEHVLAQISARWNPGPLHTPLARLATLFWLSRWSPDQLDQDLVDIEAASLLLTVGVLVEDADHEARERFEGVAAQLSTVCKVLLNQSPRYLGDDTVADTVFTAVLDAVDTLDDIDPPQSDNLGLVELADEILRRRVAERGAVSEAEAQLERYEASVIVESPRRGSDWHTNSVDWHQVPPDVLDSDENTIWWQMSEDEERIISVEVLGTASAATDVDLWVRVYGSLPVPLAIGRLFRDERDGEVHWAGTVRLPRFAEAENLQLDVYDATLVQPPRLGDHERYAFLEREAVRRLTSLRKAVAHRENGRIRQLANRSLRTLATSLDSAVQRFGPDPIATRMWTLVTAGLETGHTGSGPTGEVRAQLAGLNPWVPGFDHLAWAPTLAEWSAWHPGFGRTQ